MSAPATKQALKISIPAEWEAHSAIWTAWPSHGDLWLENLAPAQDEVAAMVRALCGGDHVKVLAMGEEALLTARAMIGDCAEIIPGKFGDIWVRDTGPIFTAEGVAVRFKNNGWGGKYSLPHDDTVGDEIANAEGAQIVRHDFILEGGALEHDGEGTILTTRQCLLNPNRNPGWTEEKAEAALKAALGAKKVLWIDEGLVNDHTDGHIDNIARFIGPGKVVCQSGYGKDDPNAAIYDSIFKTLSGMTDAAGRKLEVFQIPSPGRVENEDGDIIPASHMNFIIGNDVVALPTYGTDSAEKAGEALQKLFPEHDVVGINSMSILSGGGSFHCITQQVPA